MNVTLAFPCFRDLEDADKANVIGMLVEALVSANRAWLRVHGKFPTREIVYDPSPLWQDAFAMFLSGRGGCADLSARRIAELREEGEEAFPHVSRQKGELFHVRVFTGGKLEDPSVDLPLPTDLTDLTGDLIEAPRSQS